MYLQKYLKKIYIYNYVHAIYIYIYIYSLFSKNSRFNSENYPAYMILIIFSDQINSSMIETNYLRYELSSKITENKRVIVMHRSLKKIFE